jgi:hypothetical protein
MVEADRQRRISKRRDRESKRLVQSERGKQAKVRDDCPFNQLVLRTDAPGKNASQHWSEVLAQVTSVEGLEIKLDKKGNPAVEVMKGAGRVHRNIAEGSFSKTRSELRAKAKKI